MKYQKATLEENGRASGYLEVDSEADRSAAGGEKRVFHNCIRAVSTGYSALMHAQASSYCDRLKALLVKAQSCGEYHGGSLVFEEKDLHSLHIGN